MSVSDVTRFPIVIRCGMQHPMLQLAAASSQAHLHNQAPVCHNSLSRRDVGSSRRELSSTTCLFHHNCIPTSHAAQSHAYITKGRCILTCSAHGVCTGGNMWHCLPLCQIQHLADAVPFNSKTHYQHLGCCTSKTTRKPYVHLSQAQLIHFHQDK
jgi:hypothetical protein